MNDCAVMAMRGDAGNEGAGSDRGAVGVSAGRERAANRRSRASGSPILAVLCLTCLLCMPYTLANTEQYETVLLSRASGTDGVKGNDESSSVSLSADGRYAVFASNASNIHPDARDHESDIYLRDLLTHDIRLLSRAAGADGVKGDAASSSAVISADGHHVVFASFAGNLHPEVRDQVYQLYVRDLQRQELMLASRATGAAGEPAVTDGMSAYAPSISADGRFVAFASDAANLHPGAADGLIDVFVRDLLTHETILVSRASGLDGDKGNGHSAMPSISADGRYVAFASTATNLHPDDSDAIRDVYVRDLVTHETVLVSRADGVGGPVGDGMSALPSISADGRYVAFASFSTNLHPDDPDGIPDVYVRDLHAQRTLLISRAAGAAGAKGDLDSAAPAISADGRYVAFQSMAGNLHPDVSGDRAWNVYVRDRVAEEIVLASRASGAAGAVGNLDSWEVALSADGRYAAFHSLASNLHPDDDDLVLDVFLRDMLGQPGLILSPASLVFEPIPVGQTSAPGVARLINDGDDPVHVASVSAPAPPFAAIGGSCAPPPFDLDAGTSCELHYVFTPSAAGAASAEVLVASGPADDLHLLTLHGTGISPLQIAPNPLDFGKLTVGQFSLPHQVTLTNHGESTLTVRDTGVPVPPFAASGGTCDSVPFVLAAGQACTLGFVFGPLSAGEALQTLEIDSDGTAVPDSLRLRGTGLPLPPPAIQVEPGAISLELDPGETATQALVVRNPGGDVLEWQADMARRMPTAAAPPALPPASRVAAESTDLADLATHLGAALPGLRVMAGDGGLDCETAPGLIVHDDGTVETGYSGNPVFSSQVALVDRFTPSAYPSALQYVCLAFIRELFGPESLTFEIVVFADDGPAGGPGTELGALTATVHDITGIGAAPQWFVQDLSELDVVVASGSVYVGARWSSFEAVYLTADESPPNTPGFAGGYWWNNGDNEWLPITHTAPDYRALFVRVAHTPGGCHAVGEVPWLQLSPAAGSVPAGGTGGMDVRLDTGDLLPGQYHASICIHSNDPQRPLVVVPVAVTVLQPGHFTRLQGRVDSLGHCDAGGGVLAGAMLRVQGRTETYELEVDAGGGYSAAIDPDQGPVTVYVSAGGHLDRVESGIALQPGAIVVRDFELTADLGCTALEAAPLIVSVPAGGSITRNLVLDNRGVAASSFSIGSELDSGTGQALAGNQPVAVLVLSPDTDLGAPPLNLIDDLNACPQIHASLHRGMADVLTLDDLIDFDVVIITNNHRWFDAGADIRVGDTLADYIDAGGRVVVFNFAYDFKGWALGGRFISDGYGPFAMAAGEVGADAGIRLLLPEHPLLDGVVALTADARVPRLDLRTNPGAGRPADWSDGPPLVAYNDNVVAFNAVYSIGGAAGGWSGDLDKLARNAVLWLADDIGEPAPWLTFSPESGDVAAGDTVSVDVTFTAMPDLAPGSHHANVMVMLDDGNGISTTSVPARLDITTGLPALTLVPDQHDFGIVPVGGEATFVFTVLNTGQAGGLAITAVDIEGEPPFVLAADACTGTVLDQGASCNLVVTFAPGVTGSHSGLLRVVGGAGSATAVLGGTGVDDSQPLLIPMLGRFGTTLLTLLMLLAATLALSRRHN